MTFKEFAKSFQQNDSLNRVTDFLDWKIVEAISNYGANPSYSGVKFTLLVAFNKDEDNIIADYRDVELTSSEGNKVDLTIHPRYGQRVIDGEHSGVTRDKGIPLRKKNIDFSEANSWIADAMRKLAENIKKIITFKEESNEDSGEVLEMKPVMHDKTTEQMKKIVAVLDKQKGEHNGYVWTVDEVEVHSDNVLRNMIGGTEDDVTFDVVVYKKNHKPSMFCSFGCTMMFQEGNKCNISAEPDMRNSVVNIGGKDYQIFALGTVKNKIGTFPQVLEAFMQELIEDMDKRIQKQISRREKQESLSTRINNLIEELR